jgi:hypothetical protein
MDTRPLDMTILERAEGTSVIAAFGNQGVLVRTPQGTWERRPVDDARPAPYRMEGLGDAAKTLYPEAFLAGLTACLFAVFVSASTVVAFRRASQTPQEFSLRPWSAALIGLGAVVGVQALAQGVVALVEFVGGLWSLALPLGVLWLNWTLLPKAVKKGRWRRPIRVAGRNSPLLLFAIMLLPYLLWALGALAAYSLAAWLSGGLGVLAAALCLAQTVRLAARATRTQEGL